MKNDLAKKFLKSAVILGVGFTTFVSPILSNQSAVFAEEAEAPETEAPETETPETEEPGTETPETEEPGTETPETEEPGTETPETIEVRVLYKGRAISATNLPVVHVGSAAQIDLSNFSFVTADGQTVAGDLTVTDIDTTSVGYKEVTITLSAATLTRNASNTGTFTVPVAVANPSMVKATKEEVTYLIKASSTEANPSVIVSADGKVKLEAWNVGGKNYKLRTTNVETGETKLADFTTNYGFYNLHLVDDTLNVTDVYVFNFEFDNTPAGTDVLANTTSATANAANAEKPSNLAKTNVNLGVIPGLSGLGVMGLSGAAFVKSRKNKK